MARKLRAVPDGAAPEDEPPTEPAKPLTLAEAVEGGDYLEILKAQRRDIVTSLPGETGQAKATLHRQLAALSKEIRGIEAAAQKDGKSVVVTTSDKTWDQSAI